jgi:hypothetical protein
MKIMKGRKSSLLVALISPLLFDACGPFACAQLYQIRPLTLPDQEFLKSDAAGKPARPSYTDCRRACVSDTDAADISVRKANEGILLVAAGGGKPAMTSGDEVTVVLGPEHDQRLRRVVQQVILRLGGKLRTHDWGLGGSQEIETVEITIGADRLVLEAETYVGLSLRGRSRIVHRIEAMVKAEMTKR